MGTTENQENESANITKKKSKLPIILAVIGVIVVIFLALCAAAFAFIFLHGASDRKLKNQLSLGEKYVSELDYDNAILAYEKAIELDPKCEDAYISLGNIYISLAEQSEAEGNYEKAEEYLEEGRNILKQGYKETNSEEINDLMDEIDDLIEKIKEEAEQEEDPEDNEESGSVSDDSNKSEDNNTEDKEEGDKASSDNKDDVSQEQNNENEQTADAEDEVKEETQPQPEPEPEPEPEPALGSYEGVDSAPDYGGGSNRDVSYKVDGNHVEITVNMSETINALNSRGTSEYYVEAIPDIEAAEVEFTDGSNYFIASYSIDPAYEDVEYVDGIGEMGRPNISNSSRKGTLATSKTNSNYRELCRINASIEGDNLHWSFDIPSDYALKDKIRITGYWYYDFADLY